MAAVQSACKTSSEAAVEQLHCVLQCLQRDTVINGHYAREGRAAGPVVDGAFDLRELLLSAASSKADVRRLEEVNKGLEQQLQAAKEHIANLQAGKDAAEAATGKDAAALHPDFVGAWTADHSKEDLSVFPNHMRLKRCTLQVERCAPYAFVVQHAWGKAMFVLLPCGSEMVEVNYSQGKCWLWRKSEA
jgi:hypothetical protein